MTLLHVCQIKDKCYNSRDNHVNMFCFLPHYVSIAPPIMYVGTLTPYIAEHHYIVVCGYTIFYQTDNNVLPSMEQHQVKLK